MRTSILPLALVAALGALGAAPIAGAALVVPGANGTDGALNVTANTVIDLSQAPTGTWDQDNTADAGKGVYDPSKWGVVFKYSSVNIAAGATVSFKNHASRAPVVWLVSGDVTINGVVSLNGERGKGAPALSEPGPGGFRGGAGHYVGGMTAGSGFGIGGAATLFPWSTGNNSPNGYGYSGSYGTVGYGGPPAYGNASLIPLIGGSGGGGDADNFSSGGAGGGAILIATQGTLTIGGGLQANGGAYAPDSSSGGGSGGAIRLVADRLSGAGYLQANYSQGWTGVSGWGRIRIERVSSDAALTVNPDPGVVTLASGATAVLWPSATSPSARIVSIGGATVPDDPKAAFGTASPDVALAPTAKAQVVVETTNVEQNSQVIVRITPRYGANYSTNYAAVQSVVANSPLTLLWAADVPTRAGYSAVQVRVVRPQ